MLNLRGLLALAAAAVIALGVVAAANAQTGTGTVTVIHGVPGLTVDVYVNGDLTLEDFEPNTVTDPLVLPEGTYEIEIFAADADPAADAPAITGSATLPAGANASIIAHLTEDGTPMLSVFVNDTSEIVAEEARLVVRHTAAAPAVDVLADGTALFSGLANPDGVQADVPAGGYSVAVAAAGTTEPVIGPVDLTLEPGAAYFVCAVGSLDDESLDLLVQTISGLGAEPADSLPTAGFGPEAGAAGSAIWWAAGLGIAGLILLVGPARFASVRVRSK